MGVRIDMEKMGFELIGFGPMLGLPTLTSPMTLTLDFQGKILKLLYLRNGRIDSLGMKGMWVRYDVGCTMGLPLGHGAWQIDFQVMGQCETLTVSNLLAHEWAIHSLIWRLRGVVVLWTPCYCICKHPKVKNYYFKKCVSNVRDSFLQSYDDIVILGDANCCHEKSNTVKDVYNVYGLTNLIKTPTCH